MSPKPKPTYKEYDNKPYSELSTVESQRNEILQEEFPEGPYGAATNEARLGKAALLGSRAAFDKHPLHL